MTIEIKKGSENPVSDFFSLPSNTPETDAALYPMSGVNIIWPDFARKLERERNEAMKELLEQARLLGISGERECRLIAERKEIQKKYDTLAVENMLDVNKLCKERDKAIEVLRQIKASDWKTSGELRGMARIFLR